MTIIHFEPCVGCELEPGGAAGEEHAITSTDKATVVKDKAVLNNLSFIWNIVAYYTTIFTAAI